jgi:hypothetical protein
MLLMSVTGAWIVSGCMPDPYAQCMKEEKRRNAYLGEADYIKQSAAMCEKKARLAK